MRKDIKYNKPQRNPQQAMALGVRLMSQAMLAKAKAEHITEDAQPFCLLTDDIKLLKLSIFIHCYVTGELQSLTLAGEPNGRQLKAAWDALKLQYYDATANGAAANANDRHKLINTYVLFINRVRLNMQALAVHYHPSFVDELRDDGFDYSFTPDTMADDLQCIANELIGWEVKKEQLEKEEAEATTRNRVDTEITEDYFLEQLAELRKFEGYNIPVTRLAQEMTVYDYCVSVKRYTQYLKHLQNQRALQDGNG